jgi:uncharacterized protein (DUF58 family)
VRDLTVRGRCFLAAGAAAIICGIQIGERDFVRLGLLAMAVPVLAWLLLRRTERSVWVRRNVSAIQVEAGEVANVEVEIGNAGKRTGTLFLEEELSPALGPSPRFVIEPLSAGSGTARSYQIHTEYRGRYPVGPMHVRVGDPLGMVDLDQVLPSAASILVTPRTEPLPHIPLTGRWAGAGDNRTRDLLGGGSPDVTIREYRLGDDLRRIHWPSSARAGELMVRREEQQWQSRGALLLDTRRYAHRGEGPRSSFEVAVSAAASIGVHIAHEGLGLRLVTDQGAEHLTDTGLSWSLLDTLAVVRTSSARSLEYGISALRQGGGDGLIVAVLGGVDLEQAQELARLRHGNVTGVAVMLDVAGWERPELGENEEYQAAQAALTGMGWRIVRLPAGASIASVWPDAAQRGRFTASRGGS